MRPVISDAVTDAASVKVDWLNMWEIVAPPADTFISRVFDAGTGTNLTWGTLTGAPRRRPAIQTRTGNTPTPDASWSAFTPVVNGAIQSPAGRRYIQYSAALNGSAPALDSVQLNYDIGSGSPGRGGGSGSGTGGGQSGGGGGATQGGGNSGATTDRPSPRSRSWRRRCGPPSRVSSVSPSAARDREELRNHAEAEEGTKTVASKTFTVKGGKNKAVSLVLNKDARTLLKQHGSLKVSGVIKATDAAGNTRTMTKAMTIRRAAG